MYKIKDIATDEILNPTITPSQVLDLGWLSEDKDFETGVDADFMLDLPPQTPPAINCRSKPGAIC